MHDNAQTMNFKHIIKLAYSGIIEIKQLEPAAGRRRARLKSGRLPSVLMGHHQPPAMLASTPYAQQRTQTTT